MNKYRDKVNFVVIYVIEPHPYDQPCPYTPTFPPNYWATWDIDGIPLLQPGTYESRFDQAGRMKEDLGVSIPVLVDEMDNPVWCSYGPLPNCGYLIGTDGTIVEKESWYQPSQMEAAIKAYLGIP